MVILVEDPFTGTATGSTDRDYWLPGHSVYGEVTLERAGQLLA